MTSCSRRRTAAPSGSSDTVGLAPDQTTAALSALVPALAAGFQRNLQNQGGLEDLMSALSSGNHGQYIDDPAALGGQSALADGNGQNRDGSIMDDVTSLIGRFIKPS